MGWGDSFLGGMQMGVNLYSAYQGIQKTQMELDAGQGTKDAMTEQLNKQRSDELANSSTTLSTLSPGDSTSPNTTTSPAPATELTHDPAKLPGGTKDQGDFPNKTKDDADANDKLIKEAVERAGKAKSVPVPEPTYGSPTAGTTPSVFSLREKDSQPPSVAQTVNAPAALPTMGKSTPWTPPSLMQTYDIPADQPGAPSPNQGAPTPAPAIGGPPMRQTAPTGTLAGGAPPPGAPAQGGALGNPAAPAAPAPSVELGADGKPKISAWDLSSWSARAQQNYPPKGALPGGAVMGPPADEPLHLMSWADRVRQQQSAQPKGALPASVTGDKTQETTPPLPGQPGSPVPPSILGPVGDAIAASYPPPKITPKADASSAPGIGSKLLGMLGIGSANAAETGAPGSAAPGSIAPGSVPPGTVAPGSILQDGSVAPPLPGSRASTTPALATKPAGEATAVPAPPKGAALPAESASQPVALPSGTAKVAPNQAGPTVQSTQSPATKPFDIDPRPYNSLTPKYKAMVDAAAEQEGANPVRLAMYWNLENSLKPTSVNDKPNDGRGPLQIKETTWNEIPGTAKLNTYDLKDSLIVAGRLSVILDRQFGRDTQSSVAAYQGGAGTVHNLATGAALPKDHPGTVGYVKAASGGKSDGQTGYTPMIGVNAQALIRAGTVDNPGTPASPGNPGTPPAPAGPSAMIKYLASVAPTDAPMTDKWIAATASLVALSAMKGDAAGMSHSQDFMLQMLHQGSITNMMDAYKSLAAGNGTLAAQQLARAHAYFPDGSLGRFGVDKDGSVWAQQFDAHDPSVKLGGPMKVGLPEIQKMLITTQNPNTFNALVQEQDKVNSQIAYQQKHGEYLSSLASTREQRVEDQRTAATEREQVRREDTQARRDMANDRDANRLQVEDLKSQIKTNNAADPTMPKQAAVDKETADRYDEGGSAMKDPSTGKNMSPAQGAGMAAIHTDLRMGDGRFTPTGAQHVAQSVMDGSMVGVPDAQGRVEVFRKGDNFKTATPVARLSALASRQYLGIMGKQFAPRPQPGAQALATNTTQAAAIPGVIPPGALPQQNAPSTQSQQ